MKKSVLAIALAVLMAVSLLTVGAMADGDTIQTENSVAKYENADGDIHLFRHRRQSHKRCQRRRRRHNHAAEGHHVD